MRRPFTLLLLLFPYWVLAQRYEVVMQEIFADPTPAVGLPPFEWIELRNRSQAPVSLLGWRLADAGNQTSPFPALSLLPDSVLIVCPTSALSSLSAFGRCLGITGFPSLDNEGERLMLKNAGGQIMHAIEYSAQWHSTELKKEGGWSLEMIDAEHPGTFRINWGSATHPQGGTPGKPNSIARSWTDLDPPQLNNVYAIDSTRLMILWDEALDSAAVEQPALYELSDGRSITEVRCLPPLFDRIELRTDWPLRKEKIYSLRFRQISDLAGNQIIGKTTTRIGLPSEPDTADIRLNEILFDPPAGGVDYVEHLNIGKKILDLSKLYLSARTATGNLGNIASVRQEPRYFFPNDHLVLSSDPKALERHYFVQQPDWVIETRSLPALPDATGNLVILNAQGKAIEEMMYWDDWHFPLLRSKTGVALERIDPQGKTQDRNNWQSAAGTVGYGTPTRRNSQYRQFASDQALELSSSILSPDGDGRDDVLQIRMRSDEPANRLRLRIFQANGVWVRDLASGTLAGTEAVFSWNGLDEKGGGLPSGQYILLAEWNDKRGKQTREKRVLTLVNTR